MYKRVGHTVKVRKLGVWRTVKQHATEEEAEQHLKALYANVKDAKARP